jgi:hypothetical protein
MMMSDPWARPIYAAPPPYRPVPVPRVPVAVTPRPQPRPAVPVTAVPVVRRVDVPPPETLGIRLDDPPAVPVPPPETLGITLE